MQPEKPDPMTACNINKQVCTVCRGPLQLFGPRLSYEYHECQDCGSLQLWPMPSPEDLEKAYADHYADARHTAEFDDPSHWKVAGAPYRRNIIDAVRALPIQGRIVDFGAGWGHLCQEMRERGLDCHGIELSARMASEGIAKGLPVRQGGFEIIEADAEEPTCITLCAVFEHLSHHDQWMQRFSQRLPVGGYLVSLHPTAACYRLLGQLIRLGKRQKTLPELHGSFAPPWHTLLISLKGMNQLAQRHGFEMIAVHPASQGRAGGILGLIQKTLEITNRLGVRLLGLRWPLVTTHVFVMRKMGQDACT